MNWHSEYSYFASLSTPQGAPLGEARLEVDWIPALRWAQFEALRADSAIDDGAQTPRIVPEWHRDDGAPFIDGIRIQRDGNGAEAGRLSLDYFSASVVAASTSLVKSGTISAGQTFAYRIYALADQHRPRTDNSEVDIQAVDTPPAIGDSDMYPLIRRAETVGGRSGSVSTGSKPRPDPCLRVFVPRSLLDETSRLGQAAGDIETGGILVGRLLRDTGGEIFVRLTAQIPAPHTEATQGSLRFTPATWSSVDAAIRLRASDEVPLGWWHTHPFFCARCPREQRALCPLSSPVFSEADRALHREVFQMPWNVALLLSFLGEKHPSHDLFTWNRGAIEASRFYLLPDHESEIGVCP